MSMVTFGLLIFPFLPFFMCSIMVNEHCQIWMVACMSICCMGNIMDLFFYEGTSFCTYMVTPSHRNMKTKRITVARLLWFPHNQGINTLSKPGLGYPFWPGGKILEWKLLCRGFDSRSRHNRNISLGFWWRPGMNCSVFHMQTTVVSHI